MSILCVGQAVYDLTFPVNETLVENQKYRIPDRHECMGAPAANAAYLCGHWGAETALIARIGNDLFGQEIIKSLKNGHVDTSLIFVDPNQATSISCIIVNNQNGHRTILNSPLKEKNFPIIWPKHAPSTFLVDGHELEAALNSLEKYPHAVSIMDAGTCKPELHELIQAVDYLVCSEDFAYQATGIEIHLDKPTEIAKVFTKLTELNQKNIVITIGDKGCLYQENGSIQHFPSYQVKSIDTTGAGDIFHGAFAYCLDKKLSLKETIRMSSAASALSVGKIGGQTSIPSIEEVTSFIAQQ